jgi:hypothetical protein
VKKGKRIGVAVPPEVKEGGRRVFEAAEGADRTE